MKAQLATVPRRRPKLSAIAAPEPGLTIQVESLYDIARELPPLLVRYCSEFDESPDPDWQQMLRMTAAGALRTVTARDAGALVGFVFNIVGPHLMHKAMVYGV